MILALLEIGNRWVVALSAPREPVSYYPLLLVASQVGIIFTDPVKDNWEIFWLRGLCFNELVETEGKTADVIFFLGDRFVYPVPLKPQPIR